MSFDDLYSCVYDDLYDLMVGWEWGLVWEVAFPGLKLNKFDWDGEQLENRPDFQHDGYPARVLAVRAAICCLF